MDNKKRGTEEGGVDDRNSRGTASAIINAINQNYVNISERSANVNNNKTMLNTINLKENLSSSQSKDNLEKLNIKYVNIQGLTKAKMAEIEKLIDSDKVIICLTETHQKIDNITLDDSLLNISEMRDSMDKKGGGLMIVYKKNNHILLQKEASRNKDILTVKGKIYGREVILVLVYFSVVN